MTKNLGSADRFIRAILAIVLALLILTGSVTGTPAWILGIVAVVLLGTSVMSFCPAYFVLKLSTLKRQK